MANPRALQPPILLQFVTGLFLAVWTIVALFPLVWTAIMSFRLPLDGLSPEPLKVLLAPATLLQSGGISPLALTLGALTLFMLFKLPGWIGASAARMLTPAGHVALGWLAAALVYAGIVAIVLLWLLPALVALLAPLAGRFGEATVGLTLEHYRSVWIKYGFIRNFYNSMIVTFGVVTISLTVGTLAGYALSRTRSNLAFALLIAALIFRAMPHSVLVAGYLPVFINSRDILAPLWASSVTGWFFHLFSATPPTLYGQPLAVIMVLVAINQPFTIWMLRSFFRSIPSELDEAARVDGCSHLSAFWRVIMPVMWPGVITTGLFSFLLAYNDYLVTALLLDSQSQTMVPAISSFLNRDTTTTDQIEAIAAAVSITAPLFLLVIAFQKQIVSGLTVGAVKG